MRRLRNRDKKNWTNPAMVLVCRTCKTSSGVNWTHNGMFFCKACAGEYIKENPGEFRQTGGDLQDRDWFYVGGFKRFM